MGKGIFTSILGIKLFRKDTDRKDLILVVCEHTGGRYPRGCAVQVRLAHLYHPIYPRQP